MAVPVPTGEMLPLALDAGPEASPKLPRRTLGRSLFSGLRAVAGTKLSLIGLIMFVAIVLCAVFAPLITHNDPNSFNYADGIAPSWAHPLGTNDNGQDIFAQILYGARFTMAVGFMGAFGVTILAVSIGMFAGYVGGWIDDFLSMVMNVFLILPQLPLLIVIVSYVGLQGNNPTAAAVLMAAVITITGWAWGGRVMRAQTLSLRSRDFVDAAKVNGESTLHIVFVDMLPNMLALIVNTIILSCLGAIITETTLDYLGVGSMSQITWGTMLHTAEAESTLYTHEWWCFVFPGLAVALTILSLILMNNGVDVIANPRLKRVKVPRSLRTHADDPVIERERAMPAPVA